MDEEETTIQKKLHEAIEEALSNTSEDVEGRINNLEGRILTGWIICYETTSGVKGEAECGHIYGPNEMTTWKALGILEWIRRFCLGVPDD